MCLHRLKPTKEVREQKHWYKVYYHKVYYEGRGHYYIPVYRGKPIPKGKRVTRRQASNVAFRRFLHTWKTIEKYENGFHCYKNLEDAKGRASEERFFRIVVKVEVGQCVAFGKEARKEVGVFKTIKALEEVK